MLLLVQHHLKSCWIKKKRAMSYAKSFLEKKKKSSLVQKENTNSSSIFQELLKKHRTKAQSFESFQLKALGEAGHSGVKTCMRLAVHPRHWRMLFLTIKNSISWSCWIVHLKKNSEAFCTFLSFLFNNATFLAVERMRDSESGADVCF